jgi:long-chain fatty acid transport protein
MKKLTQTGRRFFWLVTLGGCALVNLELFANGIYLNGVDAPSAAMGGAGVALANAPLGAMTANPAGLAFLTAPEINLGGAGGLAQGQFRKTGSGGGLDETPNGLPTFGFGMPVGQSPVAVGLSFAPEAALSADWHYNDPPGGLNGTTTYGYQENHSEIILLRSALGAGFKLNSKLAFGASVGLLYNENRLKTPYIFQNLQPGAGRPDNAAFDGAKTLLDLHTTGFGWNVQAGGICQVTTNLQFGVAYQSESRIATTGDASGDPSTQFGFPQGTLPFHYDAAVRNIFPQMATAGAAWKFHPQWRLALQVDWIDWADAFRTLPVSLSNGNNAAVNGVLGKNFSDAIPLNWQSEFVYRAGLEWNVTGRIALRGGYAFGRSPVPSQTLMPLTAAIVEHTFTAGVGCHWSRYSVDMAYQFNLPVTQDIGTSGLRAGEYSNSSVEVSTHLIVITTSVRF